MKSINGVLLLWVLLFIVTCKKEDDTAPEQNQQNDTLPPAGGGGGGTLPDSLIEDNMLMGNCDNAIASLVSPDHYLMVKHQYTLSYNNSKGTTNWVSWHLSTAWKGSEPRCDCFTSDNTLPASFYHATYYDYTGSGFDRGHLCPSYDRNLNYADNAATFLMTNILPQASVLNQQTWNNLEDYCTTLMNQGNELYIIAGGYGSGGTGSQGGITYSLAGGAVNVPSDCWKVVVVLAAGSNDVSRVGDNTRVITVSMPNTQTVNSQPWGNYRISIDSLEALTGYNLLTAVTGSIQYIIEANADAGPTQ